MDNRGPTVFKYKGNVVPLIVGILALPVITYTSFLALEDNSSELQATVAKILMGCAPVFWSLTLLNIFIRTSDILIDDSGVRWLICGKERNKIAWKDIKRVRVWHTPDFANFGPPINGYSLDTTTKFRLPYSQNPPFVFNDRVENFPELIKIVNSYVGKYGIQIVDKRVKPPLTLTRL